MKKKTPLISVIMPTYNRDNLLSRAVKSVVDQTYIHWELLIIDDHSTDRTKEIIKDWTSDNPKIRYMELTRNKGAAAARNKGIRQSRGSFIAFLDSDDEWKANFLQQHVRQYPEKRKDVQQCSRIVADDGRRQTVLPNSKYRPGEDLSEYLFCREGLIHTITWFMPSAIAKEVQFDPSLHKHQDYDFVLRAYQKGISFNMLDQQLAIWHRDLRKDRMGRSTMYRYSYRWMKQNRKLFTSKSTKAFIARDVFPQIVRKGISSDGWTFLWTLYEKESLSWTVLIQTLLKSLLYEILLIIGKR